MKVKLMVGKSLIDHFFLSENLYVLLKNYNVTHKGGSILGSIRTLYLGKNASVHDINSYKSNLDMNLKTLSIPWDAIHCYDYMCNSHTRDLCSFYLGIIDALLLAGHNCIPNKCYSNNRKKHPGWATHVENKRQKAILWHKIWKSNNSPSHGLLYDIRRNSHKEYHKAIKFIKCNKLKNLGMVNNFGIQLKR